MAIASSFSSSIVAPLKYGVFLSFRGSDTRYSFLSHLHDALLHQGIPTFLDSEDFQKGSEISKIVDEIQKANVSVVILSTDYADSSWCLEELVKIMECRKTQEQHVLPVFYHVDPSDVENQTGSYGVAFEKHQAGKTIAAETLQCWRNALIEVANLSGRVLTDNSFEAQAIKDIVKDISNILQPLYSNGFQDLVGIQQRIQQVESLLCIGRRDIRGIGIWGMGGLGKTTLAEAVFSKYSSYFNGSCFLRHVRERSNSSGGINQLQQELIFEIFNGEKQNSTQNMLNRLRHKKVLVVLDDVDNCRQFDEIIGNYKMYGPGSRIIITSRDKQVLRNVSSHEYIYEILALEEEESLQLFMLYALKEDRKQKWHLELSKKFVNYVKGNPLGLKILGRHLQGKDEQEWLSALSKMKEGLHKELTEALKVSFDGLDFHDKQIFLDIACFFNRNHTSKVRRILRACHGSSVEDGLRNLADKSLVSLSGPYVDMHDLLEEMGKEIVREESRKEPGKRSRLWNHEDIYHVLNNNTGSEAVEGISMVKYKEDLKLAPTVFAKMPKLKLLVFCQDFSVCFFNGIQALPGGLEFLPKDELRHFHWNFYPFRSLPSDFVPEKLVTLKMFSARVDQLWNGVWKFPNLHEINMGASNIIRLWTGVQDMPNLKKLVLSRCWRLIKMPDLSKAPKLEELYCCGCESLKEVSQSISQLGNLKVLDFQSCQRIRSFPSTLSMMCLKELPLRHCSNLMVFPEVSRNIQKLDLDGADIEDIPLEAFRGFSSLKELHLGGNNRLGSLPNSLGCLSSLQELDVSSTSIESIPTNIIQLSQLRKLIIKGCKRLRCLPELPSSVCELWADGCESLQNVSFSPRLPPIGDLEMLKFPLKFSFADCIKLDESAREEIFAFAQQSITTVVAPTLNKLVEEDENVYLEQIKCCFIHFGVPGNEMPDWIEHQSGGGGGSSISIDFQPLNLLGFIFCAVFDFHPFGQGYHPSDKEVGVKFKVQLNSNQCGSRRDSTSRDWMYFPKVESQHVFLSCAAYAPNEGDSQYCELSATMEVAYFRENYQWDDKGKDYSRAVVKWGLSLIYKDGDDEREYRNDKGKRIAFVENADDEEEHRASKKGKRWQSIQFL